LVIVLVHFKHARSAQIGWGKLACEPLSCGSRFQKKLSVEKVKQAKCGKYVIIGKIVAQLLFTTQIV
jgi:hypothetical protein